MTRRAGAVLLLIVVAVAGCSCRDEAERPSEEGSQPGVVTAGSEAENLTFAAPEERPAAAVPEEEPELRPLELPPYDFANAPTEVEPNDEVEQAGPLSRDGEQWVARGRLSGRDFDWYVLPVEGAPQLWVIEAVGSNLQRLRYRNAAGEGKQATLERGSSRWTIANLFLLPGRHWLEVWSREGEADYTLRAVPVGAPRRWAEREPNDDVSRAHLLRFGIPRDGLLFEEGDEDYYQFSLNAPEHIQIEVEPPPEVRPRLTVWELGLTSTEQQILLLRGREAGEALSYRAWLPPGDYAVEIKAEDGVSASPYRLRLARLDPFDLPVDLEPNDQPGQARPMPPTLILSGSVGEARDQDWYRLPTLDGETRVRAEVTRKPEDAGPSYFLRLYREGEDYHAKEFAWSEERAVYEGKIAAAGPWLARVHGQGEYEVQFEFEPGPAASPGGGDLPVSLSLPAGPHVFAAFWHQDQGAELPVTLANRGDRTRRVELDAVTSHAAWSARPEREVLDLAPGERISVPLALSVTRDAWAERPVQLTVRIRDESGAQRTATALAVARCGAPPVGARPAAPLPRELLGGLNVAWSALGARPVSPDQREAEEQKALFDGLTPNDNDWHARRTPETVTVELAGSEPVAVAGFVLNPRGRYSRREQLRQFEIALSLDGREFTPVLGGELGRSPQEQAFVLERPRPARFARLLAASSHQGAGRSAALGEWKVIAVPGSPPVGAGLLNLADPLKGGHVVWSDPLMRPYATREILSEEAERPRMRLDPLNPNRWVVGFHHQRAARITTLEWVQADDTYEAPRLSTVEVALSTQSPVGPWLPIGTWQLDTAPASTSRLELETPAWARYLRFSTTEPTTSANWQLPETLRILEQPPDTGYRSALAEWGQYSRSAHFERAAAGPAAEASLAESGDNDSRRTAQLLEPGRRQRGEVLVGEDVDWYRLEIPADHNLLELSLTGDPALRVVGRVENEAGEEVPLAGVAGLSADGWRLDLPVRGGEVYYVQIEEPPRSIVLAWDNSGSTTAFKPTLYQALPRFVAAVESGREFVNLLPFQDGGGDLLLPEWSDRPYALQTALNDYHRKDGSSEAELALLTATRGLAEREGTRAVVFLTDADTHSYEETARLWSLLAEVRPRVFALELHRGNVGRHQDLMQSWAAVSDGHYDFFRTNADLEVAFDRAACHLRRPAGYLLSAATRFAQPPGPGTIQVIAAEGAIGRPAVELILDASGSMLQRLEGRRRIDIARDVLVSLIEETLPRGTPLALRIFGHRTPGSCQTELEVPLSPLAPAEIVPVIRQTEAKNRAKTPIGASLELVATDLESAEGPKIVILVTDGEETCGGDPGAAIQSLKDRGFDVRVNIVGFAIEEEALKETFRRWATSGGGLYFDATSGEELGRAMRQALQPKFQVLGAGGDVVAAGVTNGDPVDVPAGLYSVRILTSPARTLEQVRVAGEDEVVLELERPGES